MNEKSSNRLIAAVVIVGVIAFLVTSNMISSKNELIHEQQLTIDGLTQQADEAHQLQARVDSILHKLCSQAEAQDPTGIGTDAGGNLIQIPNPNYDPQLVASCLKLELGQ